jgi:TonB family protein
LDEGSRISASFIKGQVGVAGLHLIAIDARAEQLPELATATTLRVAAGELVQSFHLRGIDRAIKALDDCEKNVLISWGVDPEAIASINTPATLKSNPMSLFSVNDYPSSAMSRREQGISAVRLVVGIDGRPRNCGVVESSGSKALDAKTCDIYLTRSQYEPARTATGEAVPSIVFQRMSWEMPD